MVGGHAAGGSLQLAELIDKYGEYIFQDLHTYAGGLNLVSLLKPGSGYSPRQILILIKGLPLESATVAAMRGGDEFRGWGLTQYHIASLTDAVNWNTWAVVAAASGKKKPKQPEPTYRPTMKKPQAANNPFAQRLAAARRAKAARTQGA